MGLSAEQIEEFLDKLNDDADFRDKLVNDPAVILDEYGIDYDSAQLEALVDLQLPDPGEVNANRDAFRDALSDNVSYWFDVTFQLPTTD